MSHQCCNWSHYRTRHVTDFDAVLYAMNASFRWVHPGGTAPVASRRHLVSSCCNVTLRSLMLSAIPRRPIKTSLNYSRSVVNAIPPLQVIQRPLYELVGQRMGNASGCQLPLQLPCHKKAVSLSFCSPANTCVEGQCSRQAIRARQSAYGDMF